MQSTLRHADLSLNATIIQTFLRAKEFREKFSFYPHLSPLTILSSFSSWKSGIFFAIPFGTINKIQSESVRQGEKMNCREGRLFTIRPTQEKEKSNWREKEKKKSRKKNYCCENLSAIEKRKKNSRKRLLSQLNLAMLDRN